VSHEDPSEMHFLMAKCTIMVLREDMSEVTDDGEYFPQSSVPCAKKQMWAPDATCKKTNYYLYFPAKDCNDTFRTGVTVSTVGPLGLIKAEPNEI
jgi:hypothetical protein